MSFDSDTPFYYYLIAMTIFFLLALLVAIVGRKTTFFKRILKGKPSTLIYEGKIDYKQLSKNKIDVNDLLSMLREKNYFDVRDVAYAIFEPSGELSVLPKGNQKPVVIEDIDKEAVQPASLSNVLIVDGVVSKSGLSELGKDVKWLFERLDIRSRYKLNDIIYASYDSESDSFDVHYKDR